MGRARAVGVPHSLMEGKEGMMHRLIRAALLSMAIVALLAASPVRAEAPIPTTIPTPTDSPATTPRPGTLTASPTPATESGPPASADGTEAPTDPDTSVTIGKGPVAFHVDLGAWIGKLLTGLWKALGVNGITGFGDDIAGWLLTNPNLTATDGQMGNVQRMADALRLASLSLVIVLFLATVYRFWLGGETAPTAALGRLVTVLFALGFYKQLVGLLVAASNALAQGALHAGTNAAHPDFGAILGAIPGTSPLWALMGVISLGFLFVLGVVRMLGFAFLLVAYVLGPLVLPLGLVPETSGYCMAWAKHTAKLLFWPTLWAVEFRLFDALKEGLYLPGSVGHTVLAPFAALGMLLVMMKTPMHLHSGAFEEHARTGGRAVKTAVVTIVTGGAGGAATAAKTGTATTGAQSTGAASSGRGAQP